MGGAGATGQLTVTDPGSRLTAVGQLAVGLGGAGSLLIENQATVAAGGNTADATEGFDVDYVYAIVRPYTILLYKANPVQRDRQGNVRG